ncbi:SulP family inorganic anion transporter [Taibaiella lutea]|uniref:SulP family inorganic anion transporter n=1 Tax=Taibaiella lutea TaxID=2608001 RepID=A0A5M6CPJ2_9BACT|nr:SulP family inorganic anion transporter [Taibaiella lutea]KAA5536997.1 SulP family inorganic anion transporter [Taibaiella lutea]
MSHKKSFFATAKNDLVSGLIVFLIALPLCLGIAQASNAPLFSGIVAGVIGGIIIGFLSKSTFSVSGPAAGLVAIVVGAISELKTFEIFLCAVIVAGALQMLLGIIKAGTFANFFPTSVIEGMLAGIGLTIIFKQLPDAVGYSKNRVGMLDGERGMDVNILTGISDNIHWGAVLITIVCLGLLILWNTKPFKKVQMIPAGLVVVIIGTLLALLFQQSSDTLRLSENYLVQLKVPESAADFFAQFARPDLSGFKNPEVWKYGLIIAIVASIETLLCIEATDKLDPLKRNTSGNSELIAQGVGNVVSGLLGGLPITSVIVRSSANINAGAKSKLSTIIHGILLFACVAAIPTVLNMIPKSALAAILIFTGYRLAKPSVFVHMYKVGRTEFVPFVITAIAVALPFLGLLKGVGLGMIMSIFYLLRANIRIPYYYKRIKLENQDVITLELAQEVSFLNKGSIKQTLDSFPEDITVVIDATLSEYIDYDILEEIREFYIAKAPSKNITVSLVGFRNEYKIPKGSSVHLSMDKLEANEEAKKWSGKYSKLLKELES